MTLKQIQTVNIQNHKHITLDLKETGVTRLRGPNSAGKSVVVKVLMYTLQNRITKPKTRAGLISWGHSFGEAIFTRYDDVELKIHLTVEASGTYLSLTRPNEEPVIRYLSDKNHSSLLSEFGFHYNADRDVSLNVREGDKSILFFSTNGPTNLDVLEVALNDPRADMSLENMESVLKDARKLSDVSQTSITMIDNTLNEMKEYDVKALHLKELELVRCYNILSSIYIPELPEIKSVPNVRLMSVHTPTLPIVKWPNMLDIKCDLPDIRTITSELATLRNSECPTCGRSFNES